MPLSLIAAAFIMGTGIWSAHFIGMLAFNLPKIQLYYDPSWTILSLGIAIIASGIALYLLTNKNIAQIRLFNAGILFVVSMGIMHYSGMEALEHRLTIRYLPHLFFLSLLIGIVTTELALWLAFRATSERKDHKWIMWIGSFVMAISILGMHYISMLAAVYTPKNITLSTLPEINKNHLEILVTFLSFIIVVLAFFLLQRKRIIYQNQQLSEMSSLLKNILESAIEYSIIAINLTGKILIWNEGAKRNYGYTAAEMIGKSIFILYASEDILSNEQKDFFELVNQKGSAERFFRRVRKDKSHFIASVTMSLRYDEKHQPIGYVIISKDVTAHLQFEERLVNINNELEQFAFIVSHDLKSPLRAIVSLVSMMEEDKSSTLSEESKKYFKLLIARVKRMSNLIDGILLYSRLGRTDTDMTTVSVKALLDEILESLRLDKNIKIQYPENLPTLVTSKISLSQVFTNLIDNAIKFHDKPKGLIEIGFTNVNGYYEFFVKDDGPGIEPEYHSKIFEIFQTLHPKDTYESTGIGLSIVKKIVELQGGKIFVESELGKGTIFRFTWPKAPHNKPFIHGQGLL